MTASIERREGRITVNEYRAVVVVQGRRAEGVWQFSRRHAVEDGRQMEREMFDPAEAEATLAAESQRRARKINTNLATVRKQGFTALDHV